MVGVRSLNEQIRRQRLSAKVYAKSHGYFWLPCPLCGMEFGGHEWGDIGGKSSTIWSGKGKATGICPQCTRDGKGNSPGDTIITPVEPDGIQCGCGDKATYVAVAGCFEADHLTTQYFCSSHAHTVSEAYRLGRMYCSPCHWDGCREKPPWRGLVPIGEFLMEEYDGNSTSQM